MLRVVDISAENLSGVSINTVSLPGSDATPCVGFNALGENRAGASFSLTLSAPNATANTITVSPAGYTRVYTDGLNSYVKKIKKVTKN
jgi:hypothetical protein